MPNEYLIAYCTCPEEKPEGKVALDIASQLVKTNLAACVSIIPKIKSVYSWDNNIETSQENLLMIKTTKQLYSKLEKKLSQMHPYECPEIIAVPIEFGYPGYLNWIDKVTEIT